MAYDVRGRSLEHIPRSPPQDRNTGYGGSEPARLDRHYDYSNPKRRYEQNGNLNRTHDSARRGGTRGGAKGDGYRSNGESTSGYISGSTDFSLRSGLTPRSSIPGKTALNKLEIINETEHYRSSSRVNRVRTGDRRESREISYKSRERSRSHSREGPKRNEHISDSGDRLSNKNQRSDSDIYNNKTSLTSKREATNDRTTPVKSDQTKVNEITSEGADSKKTPADSTPSRATSRSNPGKNLTCRCCFIPSLLVTLGVLGFIFYAIYLQIPGFRRLFEGDPDPQLLPNTTMSPPSIHTLFSTNSDDVYSTSTITMTTLLSNKTKDYG